jgi:hypothetical protein
VYYTIGTTLFNENTILAYNSTEGHEDGRAIREANDTHHTLVLVQHLIVLAQRDKEQQRRDILKTVDAFLPLGTLATDVEACT